MSRSPTVIDRSVDDLAVVDHADGESGQVVFAIGIHARHLRGFAPDQSAAGLDAPLGNALDDLGGFFRAKFAGGHVIEEEKGFGTLHDDIVDAHRHQVDADRVVLVGQKSQLELGAHAVGGGDQGRLLVFAGIEGEQAAEAADIRQHLRPGGRLDQRLDHLHKTIAGIDVNAGILVGSHFYVLAQVKKLLEKKCIIIRSKRFDCQRQTPSMPGCRWFFRPVQRSEEKGEKDRFQPGHGRGNGGTIAFTDARGYLMMKSG